MIFLFLKPPDAAKLVLKVAGWIAAAVGIPLLFIGIVRVISAWDQHSQCEFLFEVDFFFFIGFWGLLLLIAFPLAFGAGICIGLVRRFKPKPPSEPSSAV